MLKKIIGNGTKKEKEKNIYIYRTVTHDGVRLPEVRITWSCFPQITALKYAYSDMDY